SNSSLELVTNHAGSASDIAFFHRAAVSCVEGMPGVFWFYVEAVDVVEVTIVGFGHNRKRPVIAVLVGRSFLHAPRDYGIAHHSYAVGIRDHDWSVQESRVLEPGCPGHFSIAVQREPGAEHWVRRVFPAREYGGYTSPHRALSDHQLARS